MSHQEDLGDPRRATAFAMHPAHADIGTVTRHRLMQIRRRMALGRYPPDGVALASEIVAMAGHGRLVGCSFQQSTTRLLAAMIDRLDTRSALLLQLEFVEQLAADEIDLVMGDGAAEVARLRRTALIHLSACLDTAATALRDHSAPIAGGGVSK